MPRRSLTARPILLALSFVAACGGDGGTEPEPPGTLRVSILTVGLNPDPDGYALLLDGELLRSLPTQATVDIDNVPAGEHEFGLADVDGTCSLEPALQRVTVPAGGEAEVAYRVPCLPSQAQGALVFDRIRSDGRGQIVVLSSAGEQVVVDDGATNRQPVWSPDGSRIAYMADREQSSLWQIWVVNADGSDPRRLTEDAGGAWSPAWSPDGTRIAFHGAVEEGGQFDIFTIAPDGGSRVRITTDPADDGHAAWSPDGSRIAFVSNREGNREIYLVDVDGSGLERLPTFSGADNTHPAWSPDGGRIAFVTDEPGDYDVAIVNADGGGALRLSGPGSEEFHPLWSPDGTLLLFSSSRLSGELDLWVASASGGSLQIVTDDPAEEARADWLGS